MPMGDAYIPEGPPHPRRARTVGQDHKPLARRSFAQSGVATTTGCSVFVTRMSSFTGPRRCRLAASRRASWFGRVNQTVAVDRRRYVFTPRWACTGPPTGGGERGRDHRPDQSQFQAV